MEKNYTQSPHYQIGITARYLKLLGVQMFENHNSPLSFDEFVILDIIAKEGPMCQRDLAKLIIKDRANTGRIANSVKEKGYIAITIDKKNNRLVNKLSVTQKGIDFINEMTEKSRPIFLEIEKNFTEKEINELAIILEKYRNILGKIVNTQI